MPADPTFLDRLDAAIGCQQCGGPLTESVSDYFCQQQCSEAYAAERAPSGRSYDYFSDVDDYGRGWSADDLADLEPVGWIVPPVWRLPRSTGDLEADQAALLRACDAVQTPEQQRACDVRQDSLDERQRAIWARNWQLKRSTGTFWHDQMNLEEAERTATTDAQRAACKLRRESLDDRHPRLRHPPFPGHTVHWGIDAFTFSPLRDWPIVTTEQAQRAAEAILARSRPADPDYVDATSFGTRIENNLPGVQRATMQISGVYEAANERVSLTITPPRMLTYELRRDSDDELLLAHAIPYREGVTWFWTPPPERDLNGCHMRVLDDGREIARHQIIDSRTRTWEFDQATAPSVRELSDEECQEYIDGAHRALLSSPGTPMEDS